MILSDKQIQKRIDNQSIKITPYFPEFLGSNSYDVHLDNQVIEYDLSKVKNLDCKKEHKTFKKYEITKSGLVLKPGRLYLMQTMEYTETHNAVPFIDGCSSIGRLGIQIHMTAGVGDNGFCGRWTLEVTCVVPVRVYHGQVIGQIYFFKTGRCNVDYRSKENNKYHGQFEPQPSRMYKKPFDFLEKVEQDQKSDKEAMRVIKKTFNDLKPRGTREVTIIPNTDWTKGLPRVK